MYIIICIQINVLPIRVFKVKKISLLNAVRAFPKRYLIKAHVGELKIKLCVEFYKFLL